MVDALASGASVRKGVGVQIPPRAQWGGSRKNRLSSTETPGQGSLAGSFVVLGALGPSSGRLNHAFSADLPRIESLIDSLRRYALAEEK